MNRVDIETSEARFLLVEGVIKNSEEIPNIEGGKTEGTSVMDSHVVHPNKQLERIRIPRFSGDEMKYLTWWVAFLSCINETCYGWKVARWQIC